MKLETLKQRLSTIKKGEPGLLHDEANTSVTFKLKDKKVLAWYSLPSFEILCFSVAISKTPEGEDHYGLFFQSFQSLMEYASRKN